MYDPIIYACQDFETNKMFYATMDDLYGLESATNRLKRVMPEVNLVDQLNNIRHKFGLRPSVMYRPDVNYRCLVIEQFHTTNWGTSCRVMENNPKDYEVMVMFSLY